MKGPAKQLMKFVCAAMASAMVCTAFVTLGGCTDPEGNGKEPPAVLQSHYLRDIYEDYFSVGAAVLSGNYARYDEAGLMAHFSSITAENEMKWRFLEPAEGDFSYEAADELVSWAEEHDTAVRGHCLVWYKSLPAWLAEKEMDREEALAVLDRHITEVMTHFGDSVYVWDVVNEALHNSVTAAQLASGDIWRTGQEASGDGCVDWYGLCGVDFIKEAFRTAARVRDELGLDVKLFYNDYSLNNPNKRMAAVKLVETLRADGIPIDGIGMQAHYRLPSYTADPEGFMKNFEDSVKTFTDLGLEVQITELDLCVYASNDTPQAFDALPLDVEIAQAEMYADLFSVCRKYADPKREGKGAVTNITTWGVADDHTWATNSAHREYPLIFARDYSEKRAYTEIIDF